MGELIASKSVEGKISLWRPDKRRRADAVLILSECEYDDCGLWFVRFGLDFEMRRVAVGGKEGKIYLFDVEKGGEAVETLQHPEMKSCIRQVAFSDDGCALVAIEDGGWVWSWKVRL